MTTPSATDRTGGRRPDALRPLAIVTGVAPAAEGSATISLGNTMVLCTASVEDRVPRWLVGKRRGWITAEYSMLPRSTKERTPREAVIGKQSGRTVEIQRLIGRSLRAVVDLQQLGERQIILDCDVLQADGGTRCAAITGAYVALALAVRQLQENRALKRDPIREAVAAVSVGIVNGEVMLDLDYSEDSGADVDANVVMTSSGSFVELQSTAEHAPFTEQTLHELIGLARIGLHDLFVAQRASLDML